MTKEDATNLLFNEIKSIATVEFRGAEVFYNKGFKAWVVLLMVKIFSDLPIQELKELFIGKGFELIDLKPFKRRAPNVYSIKKIYLDLHPESLMGKI
jgi:hypothetical protein